MKGDERGYTIQLTRNIMQAELSQCSQDNSVSWANESHRIAEMSADAGLSIITPVSQCSYSV